MGPVLSRGTRLVLTTGMLSFLVVLVGLAVAVQGRSEGAAPPSPAPPPPVELSTEALPEGGSSTQPPTDALPSATAALPGPEEERFAVAFRVPAGSEAKLAAVLADPATAPKLWVVTDGSDMPVPVTAPGVDLPTALPEMKDAKLCVTPAAADGSWKVVSGDPPFSDTSTFGSANLACTPETDKKPPYLFPIVLEFR